MPNLVNLHDFAPRPTQWLWQERIPVGSLSLVDGDPGRGKGLFTCELAARVTTGRPMYGSDAALPPAGVILLQGEDPLEEVFARLRACGANLDRVHVSGREDPAVIPDDIQWLEAAVRENAARFVVVDPVTSYLGPNVNSDQGVRRALAPLAAMAGRTEVAVLLVRHLTKGGGSNPLYRGAGSIPSRPSTK